MLKHFSIAGRPIGPGFPCFIIAEAGVNHNGDAGIALELIDVAAGAGADAVKFQTFSADRLASAGARMAGYQKRNMNSDVGQLQMLKDLELPRTAYPALLARAKDRGILFLSSPFDEESADFLNDIGIAAFKIPSGEITNLPYLRHIALLGKPMIVSTGMATMDEIGAAMEEIVKSGDPPVSLLQCFSDYPANPADQNLMAMRTFESVFHVPAGFSDHTSGITVAAGAIGVGAHIVEKHFTLDQSLPGPDHKASLPPDQLAAMVAALRDVEAALGDGIKIPRGAEIETRKFARKSIVARVDIPAGKVLAREDLSVMRPGTGLSPAQLPMVVGRQVRHAIDAGSLLDASNLV